MIRSRRETGCDRTCRGGRSGTIILDRKRLAPRSVGRPGPRIAALVVVERLKVTREADASVLTAQDGARVADVCTVDNRAPTLAFEVEEDGDGNGAADDPLRLHSFVDREVRARHRRRHLRVCRW